MFVLVNWKKCWFVNLCKILNVMDWCYRQHIWINISPAKWPSGLISARSFASCFNLWCNRHKMAVFVTDIIYTGKYIWCCIFLISLSLQKVNFSELTSVEMTHTHTHPFSGPFSGTTQVSRYQKENQSGFYWSKRQWVAVASAGPYASLHLAPHR